MAAPRRIVPALLAGALCAAGCRSQQQILTEHRTGLVSLEAAATMAGDAWLSGDVSTAYTRTLLEYGERLLAQQRADFASEIALLATDQGATLSEAEDQLSRSLASLYNAVDEGDAAAARRCLHDLRIRASRP